MWGKMCHCIPLIRYPREQMYFNSFVVCNNGFIFCYVLIRWRTVRSKQLFDYYDRYQNGMILQRKCITQNCHEEKYAH
jgi:hypothetical protein